MFALNVLRQGIPKPPNFLILSPNPHCCYNGDKLVTRGTPLFVKSLVKGRLERVAVNHSIPITLQEP